MNWSVRITHEDYEVLRCHLHQSDRDEHAAFMFAGEMETENGRKLLIQRVELIADEDFGPSNKGGYRQISSRAIARASIECEAEGTRLVWAHSHPGAVSHVGFSDPDLETHKVAHPHLIDMTGNQAVASLVFGSQSVAGEIWTADGEVSELIQLEVVGRRMQRLTPSPENTKAVPSRFARQVMIFGEAGQNAMRGMTVAVVGAGGGGSLLVQTLAHLGVGRIIILDFDRVEVSNLSRIVGATPVDALRHRLKSEVLRRMVQSIDPTIEVITPRGDVTYTDDARVLLQADFVFCATDSQFSRYAVNAICHQYLIPGAQVGAKVVAGKEGGIALAYAMNRPIDLAGPCLECGGAISADELRREQLGETERRDQEYVDADDLSGEMSDPSVITLNNVSVALAMLDFQFMATGASTDDAPLAQLIYHANERTMRERAMRPRQGCRWCDRSSSPTLRGRGDDRPLPLRPGASEVKNRSLVRTVAETATSIQRSISRLRLRGLRRPPSQT